MLLELDSAAAMGTEVMLELGAISIRGASVRMFKHLHNNDGEDGSFGGNEMPRILHVGEIEHLNVAGN